MPGTGLGLGDTVWNPVLAPKELRDQCERWAVTGYSRRVQGRQPSTPSKASLRRRPFSWTWKEVWDLESKEGRGIPAWGLACTKVR